MIKLRRLANIGSDPTALYLLRHVADAADHVAGHIDCIETFERDIELGRGMPSSPRTPDYYNRCNIASTESSPQETPFTAWVRQLDEKTLRGYGLHQVEVSENETYSRLAMGHYCADQFPTQVHKLQTSGVRVVKHTACRATDVIDDGEKPTVSVVTEINVRCEFDSVVIAIGYCFEDRDQPQSGYYASPWPIQKLLPEGSERFSFTIGTLRASLRAFDVVSSLAHRHGQFENDYVSASEINFFVDSFTET